MKVKCQNCQREKVEHHLVPIYCLGVNQLKLVYDKPARDEDLHHHPCSLLLRPPHLWQARRKMHLRPWLLGPRTSWRRCSCTKLSCFSITIFTRFQSSKDNFGIITRAKLHPPTNRSRAVTGLCSAKSVSSVQATAKTVSEDSEGQASPCSAVWLH